MLKHIGVKTNIEKKIELIYVPCVTFAVHVKLTRN